MNPPSSQPEFSAIRRSLGGTRIGAWVLHPDLGVLRRGGEEVRLNAKSLNVLLVLLGAGDRGVARDELLDQVWGAGYPSDAVVSRAIADLRAAFGEKAGEEQYLRTLPKFGYQLVAPVGVAGPREAEAAPAPGRWTIYGFTLAGLLTVAAMAIIWFPPGTPTPPDIPLRLPPPRPLTSAPGLEHQPRVAPGGEWVVYAALRPGQQDWDLFRVALSDGVSQPVAVTPGVHEHGPALSPMGEEVAYVRLSSEGCEVVTQAVVLGVPEPVADCTTRFPTLVDWSPDGRWLAHTTDDVDGHRRLHAVNVQGGERRRLSHGVSTTGSDFYPRYSPSGRQLAFLRGEPQPDHRSSLWLAHLAVGEERRLTAPPAQIAGMTWLDDNRLLYGIVEAGRIEGRVLDLASGASTPLEANGLMHPDYAPGEGLLVAAQRRSNRDLFLLGADGAGRFVAESTGDDHHGRLSPDERRVAFVSRRSGFEEIWIADTQSGAARRLTRFDGATVRYPDWHPGGERILFSAQTGEGERLFEAEIVTGTVTPLVTGPGDATTPRWLPGGTRWVYGCRPGGEWGICIGGAASPRRVAGGYFRPEPIDGETIAVSDAAGKLYRMALADGTAELLWNGLPAGGRFGWALSGNTLIHATVDEETKAPQLVSQDLASGARQVLFSGSMPLADITLSIGRNNGAVLFTRHQTPSDDLVLFEGVNLGSD